MDFLRNYFVVLLALILVFVLNVSFTLGVGLMFLDSGNIYEGNSTVKEGDPFLIICRLSLSEAVEWQKDSVPIVNEKTFSPHSYVLEEKEDPVNRNTVFAHLKVKSARPHHSGTYRCHSSHSESHQLLVESDSRLTPAYDFGKYKVLSAKDTVLVLQCNVTDTSPSSSSNRSIRWSKEGKPIKSVTIDKKEIEVSEGKLTIKRPSWSDVGNYSCSLYGPNGTELLNKADIYVIAQPYVKIEHSDLTFIEGEELKIECEIYGKPTPDVQWKFGNETYDVNTSGGAVKVNVKPTEDPNVIKSEFIIEHAKMDNRGVYTCIAINEASLNSDVSKDACNARIKDRYAALWPFLGICVEVVVLCAIIFIYEKKRNKAELEESDTDQSPEQMQGGDRPQKRGGKIFVPLEDPSAIVSTSPQPRSETNIPKNPTQSKDNLRSEKSGPDQSESKTAGDLQNDNFLKVVNIGIPCLDFKNPKPYPIEYPESSKVLSVQMQLKSCKFSGKTHLITERNQFGKENN